MPTTILQSPVGAGKTEAVLERLSRTIHNPDRPFAKSWILLATKRQEVAFRQRLIDLHDGQAIYFNAEFFNFYELNGYILNRASRPSRRVDSTARFAILRYILRKLEQDNRFITFKSIAGAAGFVRAVDDLISGLKRNQVDPEVYLHAASTQKDQELAEIYAAYQRMLDASGLVDIEGEGWHALDALESQKNLAADVDLLVVDGYDQFTPVQAALLAVLSQRVGETVITLTRLPGISDGDPQAKIGQRFTDARNRLLQAHQAVGTPIAVLDHAGVPVAKSPDLLTLGNNIFSDRPPVEVGEAIKLVEAPEPEQEIAAVLRDVKRLLLDGERPDDILIAVRDWPRYYRYCVLYGRLYNMPILLHYGASLDQSPVIRVLIDLLSLPGDDPQAAVAFRRRDLLDILHSPYLNVPGFEPGMIDLLERISYEKKIIGGRNNWLEAINRASEDYYDEDMEYYPALLTTEQMAELSTALDDFFANTIPPARGTYTSYASWLEDLIGSDNIADPDDDLLLPFDGYCLNIPQCIRSVSDNPDMEYLVHRDTEALNHFKTVLHRMLQTQKFLSGALGQEGNEVMWRAFRDELLTALKQSQPLQHNPIRSGRVLITAAVDARGLPHQHVFVPGLSEGIFPAEIPEDSLHLSSEVYALRRSGVMIETPEERTDDNGIFYELISLARASLTLSRPYIREGKPWVESHLWRMTRSVFSDLEPLRYGIGEVVPAGEVAALDEAMLAVADGFNDGLRDDETLRVYQWLQQKANAALWHHIVQGRDAEVRRMSRTAHDEHSGYLRHPDLVAYVQKQLSEDRLWSASQFNEFGACPYRFFASRLLKLEALTEPEEGLDALQLGLVNHAILESTYHEIGSAGLHIVPENQAEALEILNEIADRMLRNAPRQFHFRPSALWQQEQVVIRRRLENLISIDFSESSPLNKFGFPREAFAQELRFGFQDSSDVSIPAAPGEMIRVRGSIDRVDRVGDQLIVVDYKTGSTAISTAAMLEGRNFQMMVYLLVLDQLIKQNQWSYQVAGGLFWHIRSQQHSGLIQLDSGVESEIAIEAALQHLSTYLTQARQGDFSVQPPRITDGKCASYCDYYQLCRLAVTHQYKPSRLS